MSSNIESSVVKVLSQLEGTVTTTISYIDSEIGKSVDIPMLKEINDNKLLYDGYRETVIGYSKICDAVSTLSQTQIRLRQLRRQLASSDVGILPSMKSTLKNRVENTLNDIDLCRQSAIVLKDSYDARLRFYGSTQYMLSSSRYTEVKY